jgi:hypothetical protein
MMGVWLSSDGLDAKHLQEVVVGKTKTQENAYGMQICQPIWHGRPTDFN